MGQSGTPSAAEALVKTRGIRLHEYGGPEVLRYETLVIPDPAAGEVRVRNRAVGLNFIDVYNRTGLYPVAALPSGLGFEGAGIVDAVGEGVTEFSPGDRVAYATGPIGAYSGVRNLPADKLLRLPEAIDERLAAAMMLKGMTAQYLIRSTYRVKPGDYVLFHAAAGGVGSIACQWLNAIGAIVIGTVGSAKKADLAAARGCNYTIDYQTENIAERVREFTAGAGVAVVYDSVGAATFDASLDSLRPRGLLVSFGNASGPVPPFSPAVLAQKGSLYLTRPTLFDYVAKRDDLVASADELFAIVASGAVEIEIGQTYPLADAADAQRALEERATCGSTILIPDD
jgi:NADPH2:quinone reductase